MAYENLLLERDNDGAVAVLTVNRPKVLNALNRVTVDELRHAALELRRDEGVRAVILTGTGEKAFVAGADITELAMQTPVSGRDFALAGQQVLDLFENMGKPVIAAINGFALGGGCELAMACTIRLAADTARIALPEINLGILPGYGGTQRMARLLSKGKALEMMLTGDMIGADEAFRIGLVNRVVPAADLMNEARALAAKLAQKPAVSARLIIDAVNKGLQMSFAEAQVFEATLFGLVCATEDMREGTSAFLEKRKASFKGK